MQYVNGLEKNERCYVLANGDVIVKFDNSDAENYICYYIQSKVYFKVCFSREDKNGNSIYDEDDEYIFDDHWLTEKEIRDSESDIIVTMGEWNKKTKSYLYTDINGTDYISNAIEWMVYE